MDSALCILLCLSAFYSAALFVRFIHVLMCSNMLFIFIALCYVFMYIPLFYCIYHIFSIFIVDG